MIKFQKYYVTDGKTKVKVHYHAGIHYTSPTYGVPCVTIYSKEYGNELGHMLPAITTNNTDIQTDYFERSRARLFEGHPLYSSALKRAKKNDQEFQAKLEKKYKTV